LAEELKGIDSRAGVEALIMSDRKVAAPPREPFNAP